MMKLKMIIGMICAALMLAAGCTSGGSVKTKQGAVGGAVIGAAAGAVIGHQKGRGLEGAAIGGAVGALGGGALGSAEDEKDAEGPLR